jgi:hypothetical protein
MKLFDIQTAAGLAGTVIGTTIFINGFYFINTIGKPLILTGVLVTLISVVYLVFHARKLSTSATVNPEVANASYV